MAERRAAREGHDESDETPAQAQAPKITLETVADLLLKIARRINPDDPDVQESIVVLEGMLHPEEKS